MRTFLEMNYICKFGENQKKGGLHPELEWFLSPKLGENKTKTKKRSSPKIGMIFEPKIKWRPKKRTSPRIGAVFLPEKFIAQCKNMSVRGKFMRVRSLWNLCARTQLKGNTGWAHKFYSNKSKLQYLKTNFFQTKKCYLKSWESAFSFLYFNLRFYKIFIWNKFRSKEVTD